MIPLRREQAPISPEAWRRIDEEARQALHAYLAARKLVDFEGPFGWQHSAVNLGRTEPLSTTPLPGLEARIRRVQPLVELRMPFSLARDELDAIPRGAEDANLEPVVLAARNMALSEDRVVFSGYRAAGIHGIVEGSVHEPVALHEDFTAYPAVISHSISVLRGAGVDGPYAIALGPRCYTGLLRTTGPGGYPVFHHVKQMLDGPVVWAPALDGAVVMSLRGGDFKLIVGQDISIGYLDHDRSSVELYLEESLTFRLLMPEAAVPLAYPG